MFIFVLTLVCTIGAIFALSHVFILGSFSDLEEKQSAQDISVLRGALAEQAQFLNTTVRVFAENDETYKYMGEPLYPYRELYLNEKKAQEFQLNFIVLLNRTGKIHDAMAYDLLSGRVIPLPTDMEERFQEPDFGATISSYPWGTSGILLTRDQPLILAMAPITMKNQEGVSRGTVIIGRFLDPSSLQRLSIVTNLPVTLYQIGEPSNPTSATRAIDQFTEGESVVYDHSTSGIVAAYTPIPDLNGSPALALKTERTRDIFTIGTIAVSYFILSLLLVAAIFIGIGLKLLNRAFDQIDKNIEQLAILGDHIRNPLTVIVGLADLHESEISEKIIHQARIIDDIVTQLDRGWIESEKIKEFLRKYSQR